MNLEDYEKEHAKLMRAYRATMREVNARYEYQSNELRKEWAQKDRELNARWDSERKEKRNEHIAQRDALRAEFQRYINGGSNDTPNA